MAHRLVTAARLCAPVVVFAGCGAEPGDDQATDTSPATTTGVPEGTERLSTQLKNADGTPVANATIDFADGFATTTRPVETTTSPVETTPPAPGG